MRAGKAVLPAVVILAGAGAVGLLAAQQQQPPQFRAEINYVEVDVRVLDQQGKPIHGLTQKDFAVFEDGVRQTLTSVSVVDIPMPATTGETARSAGVRPDVASNGQSGEKRRTYLIVLDDASIAVRLTNNARTFLRRFIERSVGPDDLVGIATTGRDNAYENFTNNKPRLIAAVNRMIGQGESPTMAALNDISKRSALISGGDHNPPNIPIASGTTVETRAAQRQLVEMIHAMSAAGSGSKAIIYVSQGVPFEMITNTEGLTLIGDVDRVSMQARRGNVPIYPVDPRGLSSGSEQSVEVGIISQDDHPEQLLLNETRRGQDSLRHLADDSGGLPIVGLNDIDGGLDRIVTMSSFYYVLGYYSTNNQRDGKYRKINVTVDRPGARVLNRRGYTAAVAGAPKSSSLAGPPKSSYELREALNAVLPTNGLPLEMTAAAFRQMNGRASVAVVLETSGSELTWKDDVLAAPVEMAAVALEKRGGIKAGDANRLQLSTGGDTASRIRRFGYRWLARLDDLKPGRYQIRGAAANGPEKQGSVWYDIEIPDFEKNPLAMSDVVLASQVAALRPTLRPDKLLADELPGPPTTLREFPEGGTVAVYAEVYDNQLDHPHDLETSVVVTNERGEIAFRTVDMHSRRELTESRGLARVKAGIPLVNFRRGNYTLAVDARQASNRAISAGRAVPFQVVSVNGK
jgi:VWFA-related protein